MSTAIIDGMVVGIAGSSYIIPVANIIESIKIRKDMLVKVNEKIDVINLREEIIPVINTKQLLMIGEDRTATDIAVIVENNDRKKFAFLVDEIISKKEIVIKSLGSKFKNLKGISSGTVLSGGEIGLVLDIEELIDKSQKDGV